MTRYQISIHHYVSHAEQQTANLRDKVLCCREQFVGACWFTYYGANNLTIVLHPAASAAEANYKNYPYEVPTMSVRVHTLIACIASYQKAAQLQTPAFV